MTTNDTKTQRKSNPTLRRVLGAIVCLLFLAFAYWAGWGWLILLPLIFDYYFTQRINWSWGRNHSNPLIRGTVVLLGDLLYVVLAVSFIFTFFFQNFGIPSSSLEKTMLTGDYLFVSKLKYGPRMPMTPLGLPLVHNRLTFSEPDSGRRVSMLRAFMRLVLTPLIDKELYLSSPSLGYKRLAGYGQIERYDLVVFNFPAGDTVATKMTNPDYLTLCQMYGREAVHADKATFGDIIYRPIDRRDHYVKRLIGMPGDSLQIINTEVYANGKKLRNPSQMQRNYIVQSEGGGLTKEVLDALEINYRDLHTMPRIEELDETQKASYISYMEQLGLEPLVGTESYGTVQELPLTDAMVQELRKEKSVRVIIPVRFSPEAGACYPVSKDYGWTVDNYGPILIPKQGMTITLTEDNYPIYERCIRAYEGHQLEQRNGKFYIDGKEQSTYTFAQNYYWMMGDNRHNSADSRAWGFVPEDHIVGTPSFIWLSLNDEQGLFSGRIRWKRMLRFINAD